ncbi:MAG: hypothetical protein MR966_10635 [Lachnospiraceae bacterium]|nr:hypothetical protein [Lachnospiraceae bacterium]
MKKNKYINLFCKEVFGETGQSEGPADIICIGQMPDLDRVLDALSAIDVELLDTRFAPSGVADPEKYQVMEFCSWFTKRYADILQELQTKSRESRLYWPVIFDLNNGFVLEMRQMEEYRN